MMFQTKSLSLNIRTLDLGPEHLDGVDDADVGVVEVEEPPEGDRRERPAGVQFNRHFREAPNPYPNHACMEF